MYFAKNLLLSLILPSISYAAGDIVQNVVNHEIDYQQHDMGKFIKKIPRTTIEWTEPHDPGIHSNWQNDSCYTDDIPLKFFDGNAAEPENYEGEDQRIKVDNPAVFPHSCIVKLHLFFDEVGGGGGTGVMIGPQHVLTAAHNVYSIGKWVKKVIVIPAYEDTKSPFGQAHMTRVYIFPQWKDSVMNKDYDIALIILDNNIGRYTGWMGVANLAQSDFENQEIHVTGYPAQPDKGRIMYTMQDKVSFMTEHRLFYKRIATSKGQSGGPVWGWLEEGVPCVFGIHAWSNETKDGAYYNKGNSGTRITREKLFQLIEPVALSTWRFLEIPDPSIKDSAAQEAEGLKYYRIKNYSEALRWFNVSSRHNLPQSLYHLGLLHKNGQGVKQRNTDKAIEFLTKAAEQGYDLAQNELGELLRDKPNALLEDKQKAVHWFRKARYLGNDDAHENLIECYRKGIGVPADKDEAKRLRDEGVPAAKPVDSTNSSPTSSTSVQKDDNSPKIASGRRRDPDMTNNWEKSVSPKATSRPSSAAGRRAPTEANINKWYEAVKEKNDQEALKLLQKAADEDIPQAQYRLALCYKNGLGGLQKEAGKAVEWLRLAKRHKHEEAQIVLEVILAEVYAPLKKQLITTEEKQRNTYDQEEKEARQVLVKQHENAQQRIKKELEEKKRKEQERKEQEKKAEAQKALEENNRRLQRVSEVDSNVAIPEVAKGYEDVFWRFMKAKLIYTHPQTKETKEWVFGSIMPQLFRDGVYSVPFDLSGCDSNTKTYVSINLGFRTKKGGDQGEVWIMPRFWLAAHINDAAKHYKPILDKWSQSISAGILWTYGGWDAGDGDCAYDVTETYEELSNGENLYKKYDKTPFREGWAYLQRARHFTFQFNLN